MGPPTSAIAALVANASPAASNADFEVAKEIKPSIAEEFTKVGVRGVRKSAF